MKKGRNIVINWILMVLGLLSCAEEQVITPQARASLSIDVTPSVISRAQVPGNGDLYTGGAMEDLTLVVVNSNNVIARKIQFTQLSENDQLSKVVTVPDLEVGNYTIYAFANTERTVFTEVKTMLNGLADGDEWGKSETCFTTTPVMNSESPLLLTASKNVSIGLENNETSIDLLRPVVWFQVKLFNHSERVMKVGNLSFSKFYPSTGYILPHDGNVPESVTYGSLPTFTGDEVEVGAGENEVVYETTLFENHADSYTMSMQLQTEEISMQDVTSIANTTTRYALKNQSTKKYLIDNDGSLSVAETFKSANALWTFSGKESGYIINVGTGNKFNRDKTENNPGSDLTFKFTNSFLRISYKSWNTTYYLWNDDSDVSFGNQNDQKRDWQLQTISGAAFLPNTPLNIIDNETAAVVPMSNQIRNQHIVVTVNAYYNEEEGTFNFEVTNWQEKREEVEFN